jgi:hypothetical protein
MTTPTLAQKGIKLAWLLSCKRENIDPNTPLYLPLLFKIDAELKIPNGFYYTRDCKNTNGTSYCAGDIGCSGGCMGGSGGDGDSSGCGGGGD